METNKKESKLDKNRKKEEFWLSKGYLKERAKELAFKHLTNTVTEDDIRLYKCMTCWNKDFWISRGYSEEEAIDKVKNTQKNNCKKNLEKYTKEQRQEYSSTNIKYYIKKGYSEEEAKKALKERQRTFTLEKCIKKYGPEEGTRVWQQRQDNWQKTLNNKPQSEKDEMNKKKGATLENFKRKHGDALGEVLYYEWLKDYKHRLTRNGMPSYSKESIKWFESFIPSEILSQAKMKENEYFIHDGKRIYFYDFTFKNIVIEYHGHTYHYNPRAIHKKEWKCPFNDGGKEESIERDSHKRKLAESKGFKYFEFYSNDSKEFEINLKQEILKELNAKNHD